MKLSNKEILTIARNRIGKTQEEIAESLNISVERVKAWEYEREIIDTVDIMTVALTYKLGMMEMIFYLENLKSKSTISNVKYEYSHNIN